MTIWFCSTDVLVDYNEDLYGSSKDATFRRIQFVITEISVLRVNYFDGKKIINLILHFIYATLFIVIKTRARERI